MKSFITRQSKKMAVLALAVGLMATSCEIVIDFRGGFELTDTRSGLGIFAPMEGFLAIKPVILRVRMKRQSKLAISPYLYF